MDSLDQTQSLKLARLGCMGLLILSVFWALSLAVCPELHEWVHPDADHQDHDCAVTLFSSGGLHFLAADLVCSAKPTDQPLIRIIGLLSQVARSAQAERLWSGRGPPFGK
jgi:hypothetical protein